MNMAMCRLGHEKPDRHDKSWLSVKISRVGVWGRETGPSQTQSAEKNGTPNRFARIPFVLSVGALYLGACRFPCRFFFLFRPCPRDVKTICRYCA
jgi:hypothetical protein